MTTFNIKPIVIVVDNEQGIRDGLEELAERANLKPISCSNKRNAIAAIDEYINTSLLVGVVTDLHMEGTTEAGWSVVKHAINASPSLSVVVYTAFQDSSSAMISRSDHERFTLISKEKPDDLEKYLRGIRAKWDDAQKLLVYSESTQKRLDEFARAYAPSSLPILILGETGTGKESTAREFAKKSRINANRGKTDEDESLCFTAINCGALEPTLAFSELFGHTKGAFTDAGVHKLGKLLEASGYQQGSDDKEKDFVKWLESGNELEVNSEGMYESSAAKGRARTLFLDEVADLPQTVMAGLLRVLETKDVMPLGYLGRPIKAYCRIISATNGVSGLNESDFRKDLLYRLAGAVLTLLPLRDQDSSVIERYTTTTVWKQLNMEKIGLCVGSDALGAITNLYRDRADEVARSYQAGNFRSLRNLLHRAALLAISQDTKDIKLPHIQLAISHGNILAPVEATQDQQQHIREVFRNALCDFLRNPDITRDFGLTDLKQWSSNDSDSTARAFLQCTVVPRIARSKRTGHYELKEIETALATGYGRGAWIGNHLLPEHVRHAARLWGLDETALKDKKIAEIVKLVQEADARRSSGTP